MVTKFCFQPEVGLLVTNLTGAKLKLFGNAKAWKWLLCLMCGLFCGAGVASEEPVQPIFTLNYPVNSSNPIYRLQDLYIQDVVRLAFQQSGVALDFHNVPIPTLPQSRSISLIQQGVYDVHWMATSQEREKQLLPVRIPLFKGLIGWRLMFVHQDNVKRFAALETKQNLQKLTAGQGRDWPDTKVLESNGFRVFKATTTAGLLQMVSLKRVDYFPRSVIEIWHEYNLKQYDAIVIDPTFVLQYPAAQYLFVRKDNQILHDILETGLNKAIANGTFDQLFYQYFGSMLKDANLKQRKIIRLDNPMMSAQTPLGRKELWYSIETQLPD